MSASLLPRKHVAEIRVAAEHLIFHAIQQHRCTVWLAVQMCCSLCYACEKMYRSLADEQTAPKPVQKLQVRLKLHKNILAGWTNHLIQTDMILVSCVVVGFRC